MKLQEKLQSARRLKATYKANIEFLKGRIEAQNKPDFDRTATASGASMRMYSQLDIDMMQEKLDRVLEVIKETEEVLQVMSYEGFKEALMEAEVEGGFGVDQGSHYLLHYVPNNHPLLGRKFPGNGKKDYEAYKRLMKSI